MGSDKMVLGTHLKCASSQSDGLSDSMYEGGGSLLSNERD